MSAVKSLLQPNWSNLPLRALGASCQIALLVCVVSCGGGSNSPADASDNGDTPSETPENPAGQFDQEAAIRSISAGVAAEFKQLSTDARLFDTAINEFCSQAPDDSPQQEASAKAAFGSLMASVQRTQLYQFGPPNEDDLGAQVYSWPLSSACQIDIKLANDALALSLAVDRRGVDALEYLLHVPAEANHSCPDDVVQTHPELLQFNSLPVEDKTARRCQLMQVVAADVAANTQTLDDAWDVQSGNHVDTLLAAPNRTQTLNLITDALFYLEKVVKENKLDAPLGGGITNTLSECGIGNLCPQAVESPHSRLSRENLINNLEAFRFLFLGGSDTGGLNTGFDTWLALSGEASLADSMLSNINQALQLLNALPTSLYEAIDTDPDAVNAVLNGPIQALSSQMKFQFVQALGLRLPRGTQSDTD